MHYCGKKSYCKWEPETSWHRAWKNEFPNEWQEISGKDTTGEMHIADVFVPNGLAIEIQHSPIAKGEVEARTKFYPKICWIVNGARLKKGWTNFQRALSIGFEREMNGIIVHKIFSQDLTLLKQWEKLDALVIFDFHENGLWSIEHNNGRGSAYAQRIERRNLLKLLKIGKSPPPCQTYKHQVDLPW